MMKEINPRTGSMTILFSVKCAQGAMIGLYAFQRSPLTAAQVIKNSSKLEFLVALLLRKAPVETGT